MKGSLTLVPSLYDHVEVYLDESGDLGLSPRSSRYFVVVAVAATEPRELRRLVKKVQRMRYPHVREPMEFKFHSSPDRVRGMMCAGLARTDALISWRGVTKRDALSSFGNDKRGLYLDLCSGTLAGLLRHVGARSVHVVLDRRSCSRSVRNHIDEVVVNSVRRNHQGYFPPDVMVSHLDSTRSEGIQVADFVAGAVFQSLERSNGSYLQMLSGRVVEWHIE